ncbi:MAG: HAMP domain-containing histidine kinase [Alphaproteobacteria bacterium]|nr:HAMP domain-containing histidine kinase [Alphaproteobacteria bacterium]
MVGSSRLETSPRRRAQLRACTAACALAALAGGWLAGDVTLAAALPSLGALLLAGLCIDLRRESGAANERAARGAARADAERQRLHDAIRSMPQAVALFDHDMRLIVANDAYHALSPDPHRLGRSGTSFRAILEAAALGGKGDVGERTGAEWVEWRLAQVPMKPTERQWRDGRWLLSSEHRTWEGGLVAIHTDITQLKRQEDDLREANASLAASGESMRRQAEQLRRLNGGLLDATRAAEEAMTARQHFFANMSHELRTPLNAIIGFADLIHSQVFGPVGSPRYLEYVADIRASGAHLLDLINNVLDLSKLSAGKFQIAPEEIEVDEVVAIALRMVQVAADASELTLDSELAPGLPPLVADRRAVTQALLNLLSNAVKFTPQTGRVTVRVDADRDWFRIAVADTGIGIAREHLARLAVPFEQVGINDPNRPQGTGLGLALTKALVESHGGRLHIDSEPGAGTVVTMEFPHDRRPGRQHAA